MLSNQIKELNDFTKTEANEKKKLIDEIKKLQSEKQLQQLDGDLMKLQNFNQDRTPPLININLGSIKLKQFDTKGYYGNDAMIFHTSADISDTSDMLDMSIKAAQDQRLDKIKDIVRE